MVIIKRIGEDGLNDDIMKVVGGDWGKHCGKAGFAS